MTSNKSDAPVLDTVVLQAFGFGNPEGIEVLLQVLQAEQGQFPAEVYADEEEDLPLGEDDEELSELARGLRYARRQVQTRPPAEGRRYHRWVDHAAQIREHLETGRLKIEPLQVEELPERKKLMDIYGIGRGESACLVLARRQRVPAVFVSGDAEACEVAIDLGIPHITIREVLRKWVNVFQPSMDRFDELSASTTDLFWIEAPSIWRERAFIRTKHLNTAVSGGLGEIPRLRCAPLGMTSPLKNRLILH